MAPLLGRRLSQVGASGPFLILRSTSGPLPTAFGDSPFAQVAWCNSFTSVAGRIRSFARTQHRSCSSMSPRVTLNWAFGPEPPAQSAQKRALEHRPHHYCCCCCCCLAIPWSVACSCTAPWAAGSHGRRRPHRRRQPHRRRRPHGMQQPHPLSGSYGQRPSNGRRRDHGRRRPYGLQRSHALRRCNGRRRHHGRRRPLWLL